MIHLPFDIEKSDLIGNTPNPNKEKILWYMKRAPVSWAAPGVLRDVMTGEYMHIPWHVHSDGEYAWCSSLWYYVEKYDYELPAEFVKKIVRSSYKELWIAWYKRP